MKTSIPPSQGLQIIEEAITKAKKIMEGQPETRFTIEEYVKFYQCVYDTCIQRPSNEYSRQLYERFKSALEESITSVVLPSLVNRHDVSLLMELVKMWSNYKAMALWLSRFFCYLDRYYTQTKGVTVLNDVVIDCFCDLVCQKFYGKFRDAAISLIDEERDGNIIDRNLLKDVLNFFLDIGNRRNINFYEDFECLMLAHTAAYYSRKASECILEHSYEDYMLKVNCCLNQERERACHYLCHTREEKLLQIVSWQMLEQNADKLLAKRHAEEHALTTNFQEVLSKYGSLNLEEVEHHGHQSQSFVSFSRGRVLVCARTETRIHSQF
ncbi:hypothetical protein NE237_015941 [Protea cynaroides]|uniref:Cullin N-terminal domain-containing protein n=1 Tax=Protea cynaroides TaxID=273540 RepID=A0A9Q0QRJ3_9MAGN|nr:hypothetical protein NE237_015941 [Protea cynaroides]